MRRCGKLNLFNAVVVLVAAGSVFSASAVNPPELLPPAPGQRVEALPTAFLPPAPDAPAACAIWTQKSPATRPSARRGFAMAYDETRQQTLLFGGYSDNFFSDTWVWDGVTWTEKWTPKPPLTRPSNSWKAGMAHDAARGETVLFGGYDGVNYLNTTWTWNGFEWMLKNPATMPSPRLVYAMAFDAVRGEVVLFGGYDPLLGTLNDTWTWDGGNWTLRNPGGIPPARSGATLAFDAGRGEIILFGGYGGPGYLNDTWAWNGSTWTQKTAATPPPPRIHSALAGGGGGVLLFGGEDGVSLLGDAWWWDGTAWTQLTGLAAPPARTVHALAYDAARGEIVLFGGWDGAAAFGDTWIYSAGVSPVITGATGNTCPGTSVTLSTQIFSSYQWNRNGVPVSGATTQNFIVTQSGDYTVTVNSAACGTQTSPVHAVSLNLPCPCTIPPRFDGLVSVVNSQQSVCSLALSWNPATLNCGTSFSYSVHRSLTPDFIPSPANRIATRLTATGYSDYWNLNNNTPYYYIVRATDDMNNTDPNTVEKSGVPSGLVTAATFLENFEGSQSGGGFDNPGWIHNPAFGTVDWAWSTAQSQSPVHSWHSASQPAIAGRVLASPALNLLASSRLSFWHTRAFEGSTAVCYDGGTLESSVDGGALWTTLPAASFSLGGYDGTVVTGFGNPISGKPAWCGGAIGPMTEVQVNLGSFAGQSVKLRWQAGEDNANAGAGWYVDSVVVTDVGTALVCGCPAPSGLANNGAADLSACTTSGIQVAWTPPSNWGDSGLGTRNWTVLRGGTPIATGPCAGTLPEATLNCVDTSAAAGVSYNYSLRAANGCGVIGTTAGASAADLSNAPTGTGDWTLKTPATMPSARERAAIAYDRLRGEVVLFGGGFTSLNDTWVWNGITWTQKFPATIPPGRGEAAMAFDEVRGEIVMFGGYGSGLLSDTWVWDGVNWTQKFPAQSPSARWASRMAFDGARGEIVLFGGQNGVNYNDTWVWNGANWNPKTIATPPPARGFHALIYDRVRMETMLFGGWILGDSTFNDTWVWNGSTWTQKTPATSPSLRSNLAFAFDENQGKAVIFGNYNGGGDNQFWAWDGTNWIQITTTTTPAARYSAAMAYDVARSEAMMFGGYTPTGNLNDTWTYKGALAVIGPNANTCPDETVDLSVPAFTSYQWNRNGTPIPGATAQLYTVATSGDYSATVSNASGCAATTPEKAVTITAPCPCPRPSGLANNTAADVSACSAGIQVSWTPPTSWNDGGTGTRGWTVLRGGTPIASGPCGGLLTETTLTCLDTTAPAGVATNYSVRASNGCGTTQTTAGVSATDVNSGPTGTGDWTLKNPVTRPSVRERAAIAYDRVRGETVMFGGYTGGTLGDTWVWDGVNWTQKAPATSPSARYDAAIAYDEARGEIVLFSGVGGSNDTWVWNGTNWTQKTPANSPPSRQGGEMAYDATRGEVVLFGGYGFNDTWVWNGINWSQKTVSTPPSIRGNHMLVYDRLRTETVLFGGYNGGVTLNDTWAWDGANWAQKTPATSPSQRSHLAFAFDEAQGKAVVFGNYNGGVDQFWAWDGGNWSQIITATTPSSRYSAVMAFDVARGGLVMSGGNSSSTDLNDTWVYQGALAVIGPNANTCPDETVDLSVPAFTSYQWNRNGTPIPGATLQNFTVATSGDYSATVTNASGCAATTPDKTVTITAPCPCPRPSGLANNTAADVSACSAGIQVTWTAPAAWNDSGTGTRGWMVLRGGTPVAGGPCSGLLTETTLTCLDTTAPAGVAATYSVRASNGCGTTQTTAGVSATDVNNGPSGNGDWTLKTPASIPLSRVAPGMVYDRLRGEVVMFGGAYNNTSVRNDTWVWNGINWTQKFPATSPPARGYAAMVFDETRGETVLFGGYSGLGNLGDTWVWNGVNWTQKFPATSPSARDLVAATYDFSRQEVVIFGGCCSPTRNETWTWNGLNWTQKFPTTNPSARYAAGLVYDPIRSETMLFSGSNSSGDTWVWNGVNWLQKFPAASPTSRSYYGATFDAAQGKSLIFGNYVSGNGDNQFWAWDGGNWSQLSTTTTPSARYGPAMVYDNARGEVVLFGGGISSTSTLNDTWVYQSALAVIGLNANTCPDETVDLSVPAFTSYQWNRNSTPIPGATLQNYTAAQSGNYSATVTNATGCAATTPDKTVTITAPCPCAFTGLQSAVSGGQTNCAINLSWNPATGGCGAGVTYNVYRSISAGFTPSLSNRIATGLAATTHADTASLTNGVTYYYIVRSVSGLGVEDTNIVERSAAPAGPVVAATFTDSFEGSLSGGGFDNAGWTHGPIVGTTDWAWSIAQSQSPTHSWYSASVNSASKGLVSPDLLIDAGSTLTFYHTYNTESCCDRLYLEVSTNGGTIWSILPAAAYTAGGYNCGTNWCGGTIGSLTQVDANLGAYAGQTIKLRWRETDDSSVTGAGWYVDSVSVTTSTPSSCTSGCTPPAPTVTTPGACSAGSVPLSTQSFAGYQWYRNGSAIPGATGQNYTATLSGNYSVVALSVSGCAGASPVITVTIAACCPPVIGNNTAADADSCAYGGNNIGWALPSDWGDGGGTRFIAVLRDSTAVTAGGCAGLTSTQTACTDTLATAGVSHGYAVRFTNGCGSAITSAGAAAADVNNRLLMNWSQQLPAAIPPGRLGHGIAYDAARSRIVLFGGLTGSYQNDTWLWNGVNWAQQSPPASPSARYTMAMAYDEARAETVLFGGYGGGIQGDTWVWNGANWTEKVLASGPIQRSGAAMTFDSARGEMVLFGGYFGVTLNDTWVWNGTSWSERFPSSSPPARQNMALVYDPLRNETVLFGGFGTDYLGDTWTWNGANWTQKFPAASPTPRHYVAAGFDRALGMVLIFGGNSGTDLSDTWGWNGSTWIPLTPAVSPSARNWSRMAFDGARGGMLLYGGNSNSTGVKNDTWTLVYPTVANLLLAKSAGDTQANYTWPNIPLATSYTVYQDVAAGGTYATVTGTAPSGAPGLTVPMPAGNSLFFRVAAANSCGEGPK